MAHKKMLVHGGQCFPFGKNLETLKHNAVSLGRKGSAKADETCKKVQGTAAALFALPAFFVSPA